MGESGMTGEASRPWRLVEAQATGEHREIDRALAVEAPIAIEINGIGYAVMMATPVDLADYALGFCLSEQLIERREQVLGSDAAQLDSGGWVLRINLAADNAAPLLERARLRLSEGSCGLCGMESLEQVLRPLPPVAAPLEIEDAAIFRALKALPGAQPLGRETRAVHAAAFCRPDGAIVAVREDVGRHNAFDKLIGALASSGEDIAAGFVVLTARCSFELVQKAIVAGCPVLVTVSAPTTLAMEQASSAGLRLVALARSDSFLEGG